MRRILFVLLLTIATSFFCYSQTDVEKIISKALPRKIHLKDYSFSSATSLPFNKIVVFDERFDTAKLAYAPRSRYNHDKIILARKWEDILNKHFKNVLDSNAAGQLVIVIRTFWMTINNSSPLPRHKVDETGLGVLEEIISAFDIYSCQDSVFRGLFRLENNNQFVLKDYTTGDGRYFFFLPFDSVFNRLLNTGVSKLIAGKKSISIDDFKNYYSERKNISVLTQANPNKGVYMTFNDFKENKPSGYEYRLERGKATDELYIIKDGKEELLVDFWGVYDGKNLLIKYGLNLFTAVRQNNTFEIYGGKDVVTKYFGGGDPISTEASRFQTPFATGNKIIKKMMQLNMDDGKLY